MRMCDCVESVLTFLECAENFQYCCDPEPQPQLLPNTFTNSLFLLKITLTLFMIKQ